MSWLKSACLQFSLGPCFTLMLLCGAGTVKAQETIPLIDFFYEALSLSENDTMSVDGEIGEFTISDHSGEVISPKAIITKYPDAVQYLVDDSVFVIRPKFLARGRLKDLAATSDSRITIKNFRFSSYAEINIQLYSDLENEVFNASRLNIKHCTFEDDLFIWFTNFRFNIEHCSIDHLWIGNESVVCPMLSVSKSKVGLLQLWAIDVREVIISKNEIGHFFSYEAKCNNLSIWGNTFRSPNYIGASWQSVFAFGLMGRINVDGLSQDVIKALNKKDFGNTLFQIRGKDRSINGLYVHDNQFLDSANARAVIFDQRSVQMTMMENQFQAPLLLLPSVQRHFVLEGNDFDRVTMGAAMPSTPQNYVSVTWQDLKGKLYHQEDADAIPYFAKGDEELADQKQFFNLMGGYSRLLDVYKSYGNLDDANDVFLDMKALHAKRHSYMYRTHGGLTNFFKLNLSRLLSVYTRHGTDPAQAMTASLWIIIFFSVIYFFFPSDWDLHSKSKLLSNFREMVEKNEKGFVRPFLSLMKGLVYSFFNAITLSVNSFVTLGFGTIPTRGLAKYICIFQGFLGWFLLSIFIVALINQILI